MSRTTIARGAALVATAVLALTACGGTDEAPAEEREPAATTEEAPQEETETESEGAESEEATSEESTEAEEGEDGAAAGESAVLEIGTELTDPETGDVVTIVSAVRNVPTEFYLADDNPDGEMIYLEVSVKTGDSYGGVLSQQDFYLEDGGEEVNYASSADDEVTAAGYEYFDGAPRRDGGASGYIPIYVETTGDTLKGVYVRPEMKVLGEDTVVPEFRGEFEIPAA